MPVDLFSSVPLATWEIAVLVGVSLAICVISTSMAMESAALFVPAFLLGFPAVLPGFPTVGVNEAIGLTLVVMFFGQTSANIGYWLRGQIDFGLAGRILVWTVPLAIVGRLASYVLPETVLLVAFAGLLVGLAGVVATHAGDGGPDESASTATETDGRTETDSGTQTDGGTDSRLSLGVRDRLSMSGGGGITGLVGLGMGEVSNTIISEKDGVSMHRSIGTSTLVLYLTVLAAAITNGAVVRYGEVMGVEPSIPWAIAAIIAPVVVVGGQLGAYLNSRLPEQLIVRVLIGLYLLVAIVTLLRVVG